MTPRRGQAFGLLVQGAGSRLIIVAIVIALLWAAFFWATATPGGI
ncbi:MAG: hypothetical protein AAGC57_17025 [Pseudomonadota bacterium]